MLLAFLPSALLLQGCSLTDVYCSKQTGSSSTKTITLISSFLRLGRRKLSMQPKFVAAHSIVKTGNPANIRKWIARFYYFRHLYSAGSACVLLTIIAWVAHRYGQLYLHCSLIYFWVPSSCFLHSDQPLSGGGNPVQRCLPVEGVIHAGALVASRGWRAWHDATDDDQRQYHPPQTCFQL